MSGTSCVRRRRRRRDANAIGRPDASNTEAASRSRGRELPGAIVAVLTVSFGVAAAGVLAPGSVWDRGGELDAELLAVVAGLLIVGSAVTAGLVLLGKRALADPEEAAPAVPAIEAGDAEESAQFAVVQDETGDWTWRILYLEALAESADRAATQPEAAERIDHLQSTLGAATLLELTTPAFRLHEDGDGGWRWTLVREDGSRVASCVGDVDDRANVETAVSFVKDHGPAADVIDVEGAAFTFDERRDRWHWDLVDADRTPLATSAIGAESRDEAAAAARTFAERFEQVRVLDVETVGVELLDREDDWTWRVVDAADDVVADATVTFDSRREAESGAEAVLSALESASVTVAGEPAYERYEDDGAWRWRLVDDSDRVVARAPDDSPEAAVATRQTELFAEHAPDADVVAIDDAEFEVYPASEPDGASAAAAVEIGERPVATTEAGTEAATDGAGGEPADTGGSDPADAIDADPAAVGSDDPTDVREDESAAATDWHWRLVTDDRDVVAASTAVYADAEAADAAIDRVREQAREADLIEFETAAFQVYESDAGEWRWRLIDEDGNVLADSGEEHASRSEAAEAMLTLKEQAPDADVLEIDTAAFELFVTPDDEWGWRLIDSAGKLVAEDPTTHPTRGAARQAMHRLLEHLDADVREMPRAVFHTSTDEAWHWRFVLPSGEPVAVAGERYPTRDALLEDLERVRETAAAADRETLDEYTVQLYDSGEWHWRLLDRDREPIAEAAVSYADRDAAREAVATLTSAAADAPLFAIDDAAIRLVENDGWRWELVTSDRDVLARAAEPVDGKADVLAAVDDLRRLAPLAEHVDFGTASFELVAADGDRWQWQLLDEDGDPVATGATSFESKDAARKSIADVRPLLDRATVLALDGATFELHADGEEWTWRLVEPDGTTVLESTRTYATRTAARETIGELQAHAPDGGITIAE